MTINGVDVSSYQPDYKPGSGVAFVGVKATEGTSYVNPYHDAQVARARAKDCGIIHYHWLHHGSIKKQAKYFVQHAKIQAGDILAIDWEQAGVTVADKNAMIEAVKKLAHGYKVILYCSASWWNGSDKKCGDGLWVAHYGVSKPGIKEKWLIHQYSDKPIDQNRAQFASKAAMKKWAKVTSAEKKAVAGKTKTVTTKVDPTLNAIHTPYGQMGSMWSKGYHQGDDWHRGAGAAEIGDPIVAVAAGKVLYAGDARKDGGGWGPAFGKHVLIQWDEHGRTSIDAHMNKVTAKVGKHVKAGQKIGEKGMTGNVTGPHDHHEQHLGTRWTDKDVKPIYPGKQSTVKITAPPTEPKEASFLDMKEQKIKKRTKAQSVKTGGKYYTVRLEDSGDVSWAFGAGTYRVTCRFVFSDASANDELMVRASYEDTEGSKVVKSVGGLGAGLPGGAGDSYREFEYWLTVGAPAKGRTRRLRIKAANYGAKPIKISSVTTRVWKA